MSKIFTTDLYDGFYRETQEEKYKDILRIFPEIRGKVLSVGIGPGWFESKLKDCEIFGIDIHDFGPFNYTKGDGNRLPYDDETFDFVLSLDSIHFIKTGDDMKRVLKKGGFLIVSTHINYTNEKERESVLLKMFGDMTLIKREIIGKIHLERDLLMIFKKI